MEKINNHLQATLQHVLTGETISREFDTIVVENGVIPMDDLYHELKPQSRNLGQLDHSAMMTGKSPFIATNSDGAFVLARLGDAVSGRNIHAAIYDALRVCKDI